MAPYSFKIGLFPGQIDSASAGCGGSCPPTLLDRDVEVLTDLADTELDIESDRPVIFIPFGKCQKILSKLTPHFAAEYLGPGVKAGGYYKLHTSREILDQDYFDRILRSCQFVPGIRGRREIFEKHAEESLRLAKAPPPPFVDVPSSLLPDSYRGVDRPTVSISGLKRDGCLEFERKILTESLKEYPGICLGENHTHRAPKFFLIDHMAHLKEQGLKVLYMEFALFDIHQEALEAYNKSAKDAPLPAILEDSLRSIDQGQYLPHGARFTDVFRAAHEAGIEIVAIDTERSCSGFHGEKKIANERVVQMNKDALAIIQKRNASLKEGEKYLIYCGHAHAVQPKWIFDVFAEPGLAQTLRIPAIKIEDEACKEIRASSATVTFNDKEKIGLATAARAAATDLPSEYYCQFKIKRPEVFGLSRMTALDEANWDVYIGCWNRYLSKWKDKKDGKALDPVELNKDIETVQSCLLSLYRFSKNEFLIDNVRNLLANLKSLKEGSVSELEPLVAEAGELKEKRWSSSQAFCVGYYDISQAEKICDVLAAAAPEGVCFPKEHLTGFIEGGTCSALCIEFLIEFFNRRKLCNLDEQENFFDYVGSYKTSWRENAISTRAIQAAMNTIHKSGTDPLGSSEKNMKALLSVGGFTVSSSSEIFDLNTDRPSPAVLDAIKSLPQGCSAFRTVLPGTGVKGEAHGHTMIVIRQGSSIAIYDPNKGVRLFTGDLDKSSLEIYKLIYDVHLSFNTPKLQIHYIKDEERIAVASPLFSIEVASETSSISKTELLSLTETMRYYFLKYADQVKKLQKIGLSFKTLSKCPEPILAQMLSMPSSIEALQKQTASFEEIVDLIDKNPQLFNLITSCQRDYHLAALLAKFPIHTLTSMPRPLLKAMVDAPHLAMHFKKAVMPLEVLITEPTASFIAKNKKRDRSLAVLLEAGFSLDEIQAFPEEVIAAALLFPYVTGKLRNSGSSAEALLAEPLKSLLKKEFSIHDYQLAECIKNGIPLERLLSLQAEDFKTIVNYPLSISILLSKGVSFEALAGEPFKSLFAKNIYDPSLASLLKITTADELFILDKKKLEKIACFVEALAKAKESGESVSSLLAFLEREVVKPSDSYKLKGLLEIFTLSDLQRMTDYELKCCLLAPSIAKELKEKNIPLSRFEEEGFQELLSVEGIRQDQIAQLIQEGYSFKDIKELPISLLKDYNWHLSSALKVVPADQLAALTKERLELVYKFSGAVKKGLAQGLSLDEICAFLAKLDAESSDKDLCKAVDLLGMAELVTYSPYLLRCALENPVIISEMKSLSCSLAILEDGSFFRYLMQKPLYENEYIPRWIKEGNTINQIVRLPKEYLGLSPIKSELLNQLIEAGFPFSSIDSPEERAIILKHARLFAGMQQASPGNFRPLLEGEMKKLLQSADESGSSILADLYFEGFPIQCFAKDPSLFHKAIEMGEYWLDLYRSGFDIDKLYSRDFFSFLMHAGALGLSYEQVEEILKSGFPISELAEHEISSFLNHYPLFLHFHSAGKNWNKLFSYKHASFIKNCSSKTIDLESVLTMLDLNLNLDLLSCMSPDSLIVVRESLAVLKALSKEKDFLPKVYLGKIPYEELMAFLKDCRGYDCGQALRSLEHIKAEVASGRIKIEDIHNLPPSFFLSMLINPGAINEFIETTTRMSFSTNLKRDTINCWDLSKVMDIVTNRKFLHALHKIDFNLYLTFVSSYGPLLSEEMGNLSKYVDKSILGDKILVMPPSFILAVAEAQYEGTNPTHDEAYNIIPAPLNKEQNAIVDLHQKLLRRGIDTFLLSELDPNLILLMAAHQETFLALIDFGVNFQELCKPESITQVATYSASYSIWYPLSEFQKAEERGVCKKSDILANPISSLCRLLESPHLVTFSGTGITADVMG